MDKKLLEELISDTGLDDIAERYRDIAQLVGIRNFVLLSNYARGDAVYFPKAENALAPARNRRIQKEYDGYNRKQLAEKYNLTTKQIRNIIKDVPTPGQMTLDDLLPGGWG